MGVSNEKPVKVLKVIVQLFNNKFNRLRAAFTNYLANIYSGCQ
jgi:hypothetical protein